MAGVSSVQPNYKVIALVIVAAVGAIYFVYSSNWLGKKRFTQADVSSWKTAPMVQIPQEVKDKAKEIQVKETTLTFTSGKKVCII